MSSSGSSRRDRSSGSGSGAGGGKRNVIMAPSSSVTSDKGGKDEGASKARPSVFSRLGIKGKDNATTRSLQWSGGASEYRSGKSRVSRDGATALASSPLKKSLGVKQHPSGGGRGSNRCSPAVDPKLGHWEHWDEKNLDYDDELMLEKKRQLLERELAKEAKSSQGTSSAAVTGLRPMSSDQTSTNTAVGKRDRCTKESSYSKKAFTSRSSSSSADASATSDTNSESDSDAEEEGNTRSTFYKKH